MPSDPLFKPVPLAAIDRIYKHMAALCVAKSTHEQIAALFLCFSQLKDLEAGLPPVAAAPAPEPVAVPVAADPGAVVAADLVLASPTPEEV